MIESFPAIEASISELLKLSVAERILIVQDLWDSIAAVPESIELTEAQKRELDKRLNDFYQNAHCGTPWEILKARLLKDGNQRNDRRGD